MKLALTTHLTSLLVKSQVQNLRCGSARRWNAELGRRQVLAPMTRRPRPVHRPAVARQRESVERSRTRAAKLARPKAVDFLSGSEDGAESAEYREFHRNGDSDDEDGDGDSSDGDVQEDDAPRVAQWVDDEELDQVDLDGVRSPSLDSQGTDDGHTADEAGPSRKLRSLEDDLSTLPLGALRSAQRSLAQAHALSDSEEPSEDDFSDDDDPSPQLGKDKKTSDQSSKSTSVIPKRTNKHAPVQLTSKRPVSRRRVVVVDALPKPRDPRFMHATGRYDPAKFKQQYDFLTGLRSDELSTLRQHMKRAQKLLVNSPSHLRAEREEEVKRLERAMKRTESAVNLDNRERIDSKALRTAKQTEKEKRQRGKAGWWMKRSEKKALLDQARLDAIASSRGRQAVKRAIEKKQKKVSQKEKKMRPFPRSEGSKRHPAGLVDTRGEKRRRVV